MRKFIPKVLAATVALSLLGGCNNNTGKKTGDSKSGGSDEKVTIRVSLWDYSNTQYYKTMFEAFNKVNPNISYDVVEFSADEYPTAILTQLAGKQDFDVVFNKDLPTLSSLIAQGHIMAMDDLMKDDTSFDKKNYSGLIEQLAVDGKTYGVPFRKDNNMLFYNKDLFDKAGVEYPKDGMTMKEYADLAAKMTSGEGNEKVYGAHMHTWPSNNYIYTRRTEEFNPVDPNTYEKILPYYQTLLDMQKKGYIQDYGALKSGNIHYSGVFYNQQAAMLQIGSWFINMLVENADFNWGVVTLPNDAGVVNEKAVGGVTPVSIGAYAKQKDAAWQFIKYICGEEGAKVLAGTGILPGYGSAAINSIFDGLHDKKASVPEGLSKYIDIPTYVIEFPMNPHGKDIDTIFQEEHSAIMTGNITAEQGVKNMAERVKALK